MTNSLDLVLPEMLSGINLLFGFSPHNIPHLLFLTLTWCEAGVLAVLGCSARKEMSATHLKYDHFP